MIGNTNADRIQQVLSDNLFPTVNHVSDVKQVLEYMENVAQSITPDQIRAAILLEMMGKNTRLHPKENPYTWLVERIIGTEKKTGIWKKAVAPTATYLDTLQELIPKPPKPVIVAPSGQGKGGK